MSELISIIVPIYNASKYLRDCIESILSQTYSNLEIILIDDGSTDDSARICRQYQKRDRRIKIISQSNSGSVSARKAGLRASIGSYIGFVDADDYIEPNMFESLYKKIKEHDVEFVNSGMIVEGKTICKYAEGVIDFNSYNRAEYMNRKVFETQELSFALWSKLFRAELIKKAFMVLPNEQCFGEDLLCLCNYLSVCRKFYMLKEAFYHYRVLENSLSHLGWLDICIEEANVYTKVLQSLQGHGLKDSCKDSVRYHYKQCVLGAMGNDQYNGISVATYILGSIDFLKGKRVILYGAGYIGWEYYYQIARSGFCELVAWVDKEKYGIKNLIMIEKPEKIKDLLYDVIVIAAKNQHTAVSIREDLKIMGIEDVETKIIWREPVRVQ